MSDKDRLIGEVFEDRDGRMAGRRVRVIARVDKKDRYGVIGPAYRVEVILAPAATWTVGHASTITPANLARRFRKVSH